MRVSELIELLEEQDPHAEVMIMTQRTWPFESGLFGVAVRTDFVDEDKDCDDEPEEPRYETRTASSDVFLVEGKQLRYGSRAAWRVAAR